ncbi:MAG: radical SAM protein [Desulfobacterales bacterium]|nr:radical SAM protein [Desulfobacterales bacterium]
MKTRRTVSFSKNATNIFFHITTKCNLKCLHCYINHEQHGDITLPIEKIIKWLSIFKNRAENANVVFLGGEPTLHPELSIAIKEAKKMGYVSITVDTNGYLFHDILSKVNPKDVDYFSFSMDGATLNTNDYIRGKGSYNKCLAGIDEAKSKGFGVSLIYTVSQLNIHELHMMIPIVKKLNIDRFFIQVIGIRGNPAKDKNKKIQVSKYDWVKNIPSVAEKIAENGIIVTYPKVFLDHDEKFECAGLVSENYFIFPNGRVYKCPLCEDLPLHSLQFLNDNLIETDKINEQDLFALNIPEGCVMNKIIQPSNLGYDINGIPIYKIACCMLKEEIWTRKI